MGSFQVYSMPVFDMIETQLVKRGISNGLVCRLIYRSAYVVIVAFVGITLPFFGDLLGFIGEPALPHDDSPSVQILLSQTLSIGEAYPRNVVGGRC